MSAPSKQQNSRYEYRYDSVGPAGDHANVNVNNHQQAANKTNRTFDYYPYQYDYHPAVVSRSTSSISNNSIAIHSSTTTNEEDTRMTSSSTRKQDEQHQQYYQHSNPYSYQQQYDYAAESRSISYPRSAPSNTTTYQQAQEYHQQHSARSNPGTSSIMVPPNYHHWPAALPLTTSNQAQQNNTYDASFWHAGEEMASPHPTSSGDFADYSYHSRQQQQQQQHRRVEEEEPKRKLKKSKAADDEPRRPLSAYNFFFSEEKEIVVALLPDKKLVEESFTDPDDTDTQVSDMDVDKIQEYLIEAKRNLSSEALVTLRETVESQTKRTLLAHLVGDKPKKSHKKRHGKISFQKLASVIGRRWRDLSDDDKERYFASAKADLDRFRKQMEQLEERTASTTRSSGY